MIDYAISIKYMIAGFTAFFTLSLAYLISLIYRWKKLHRDLHMLEDLENQETPLR